MHVQYMYFVFVILPLFLTLSLMCTVCEMSFHRYGCVDERLDTCKKEKKKSINSRKCSGNKQREVHLCTYIIIFTYTCMYVHVTCVYILCTYTVHVHV